MTQVYQNGIDFFSRYTNMRSCDINYDTTNGVFDFSNKRMVVSDFRSGKLWNGAKLKYIRELNFNGGSLSQEHIDDIPQVGVLEIIGNFLPAITSFKNGKIYEYTF